MKEIGIFGGTFSPVHLGHVHAAHAFYDELGLNRLIIIPSFCHPCKKKPEEFSAEERFRMLNLAFKDDSRDIVISDYEIKQNDVCYTADTLLHFKKELGDEVHLNLLVGEDLILSIGSWRNAEKVFELARIVYIKRKKADSRISKSVAELKKNFGADIKELAAEPYEISSTDIRNSVYEYEKYLPDGVKEYIKAQKRAKIISKVRETLSEKRQEHVFSTEKEALKLGKLAGLDEVDLHRLSTAALLHDITKELSKKEHTELMDRLGESFNKDSLKNENTLHAESGAYYARALFPSDVDDKVFSAIFRHTTGSKDMSLLDKILYLADFTEPTRAIETCKKESLLW